MGGSSKAPAQQTVTQTNLPEYARPYFERMMARTEASSNEGYQPFPGQRVEGLNAIQNQGINSIANTGPNWAAAHAINLGAAAQDGMMRNADFQSGPIQPHYYQRDTKMFGAPDRVQATFRPGEFDAATADKYMSPYQQKVIDIQKREATRQHGAANVGRDMQAAKAGAFGGSRATIMRSEADRNHAQQLDDIQAKGSQQAYENAQQQMERDRQARYNASQQGLGASQFNSQQQMAYGQAGQQNQQFNESQRERAAAMGLQGQIANEQARAAAAGLRTQAWGNVGTLANTMGSLGKNQQELDMQRYQAQIAAGDRVQQQGQNALDAAYDDFVNQRDYDKQQLNFYSGILRGVPVTANTDVQVRQPSNPLSQIAGLGVAGLGAYKAYQGQ